MQGKPFEQARQATRQLLDRLDPDDTFNIIAFNATATPMAACPATAEPTALRRGWAFLDSMDAGGGAEMLEPLRLALQMPPADAPHRIRTVVVLTAGSIRGERQLLRTLRPVIGQSRIIAFGIDTSVNRHFAHKLAAAGRGFAVFLHPGDNIAPAVERTLQRLSQPVLTGVELGWADSRIEEVMPEGIPDVYRDQPLVVLGRFRGASPPTTHIERPIGRPAVSSRDSCTQKTPPCGRRVTCRSLGPSAD